MSDFGESLIESSKDALIMVYKERIKQLEREVARLCELTLSLSIDRHVPAMRVADKMHKQQAQATDDYMALLDEMEQLKVLLKETYVMLDYDKNSKRYHECIERVEEALGITYE